MDYEFSWIVFDDKGDAWQINGDRAGIIDGAFCVYANRATKDYLIGTIRNWQRVEIMSQVSGDANAFSKLKKETP